jgi:hypothetical protein
MYRYLLAIAAIVVGLMIVPAARAADATAAVICTASPTYTSGGELRVADFTTQSTIANGRTIIDVIATFRVDPGVLTITAAAADGTIVGTTSLVQQPTGQNAEGIWMSINGLPARGDITLTASVTDTTPIYAYQCNTPSVTVKRAAGIVFLGRWSPTVQEVGYSSAARETAAWGRFAYDGSTVLGAANPFLDTSTMTRGSCQRLLVAPVKITAQSSGVAGSKRAAFTVKDQCDLVPVATVRKQLRLTAGVVDIGPRRVAVRSTLNRVG